MAFSSSLSIADLKSIYVEEITAAGGTVTDTYEDEERLFTRSILPWVGEVRREDRLQGGVALRALEDEVRVHPYVFRQVCSNGAIMAHTLQTKHLQELDWLAPDEVGDRVRAAIQECCVEDAFTTSAEQMRSALEVSADSALSLLPFLARSRGMIPSALLQEVRRRFFAEADTSTFGLVNAVTSVARDTQDPDMRWRLEELGGGILVADRRPMAPRGAATRSGALV